MEEQEIKLGALTSSGFVSYNNINSKKDKDILEAEWDVNDREQLILYLTGKIKKQDLRIACWYEYKIKANKGLQISNDWDDFRTLKLDKVQEHFSKKVVRTGMEKPQQVLVAKSYHFSCLCCNGKKIIFVEE